MRKSLMVLVLAITPLASALAQHAQDGIYLEMRGGATFVPEQEFKDSGITLDSDFDTGWNVAGAAGYAHSSGLRGEIELGYRRNGFDEIESVSVDDIHLSVFSAMFNGYYDFHLHKYGVGGALGNLSPFIGGGVGVGVLELGGSNTSDESDAEFAYQAGAGIAYHFTPNISASARYMYFATTDPKFDGVEGEYDSHNAIVGIRYSF